MSVRRDESGPIDVAALIAEASAAEHVARADAYFGGMTDDAKVLRKPFFGLRETQANLYGASAVLQLLRLFMGARVLDFGAGTGWFSRMLAFMECRPIAVDVSPKALALGRGAFERDPVAAGLSVDWRAYDGVTLPLEDASVDRIVCYDSFHHVADQGLVLREFCRVLVPGGRVAFHEPGPEHSRSPVSQFEMRQHGVIENDIVVERIWALAEGMGFTGLEMALTAPVIPVVGLADYQRVVGGGASLADAGGLVRGLVESAASLRVFAMTKGAPITDSRAGIGLAGEVTMRLGAAEGGVIRGWARAVNTGPAAWWPSVDEAGGVWLGVKEPDRKDEIDVGRVFLSAAVVGPGAAVEVEFTVPAPKTGRLAFDLVAEYVTWFESLGAVPVVFVVE